jgi:hypothetical protein
MGSRVDNLLKNFILVLNFLILRSILRAGVPQVARFSRVCWGQNLQKYSRYIAEIKYKKQGANNSEAYLLPLGSELAFFLL